MRKVVMLSALALAGLAAFAACGDDDDDGDNSGSNMCDMPAGQNMSGCSQAQIKEYSSCVEDACSDKYEECYGPNYKKGEFSGACASYMECVSECDCDDAACTQACTMTSACQSCVFGFASCSSSCIGKLSCATGGSGDGGTLSFDASLGDSGVVIKDGSISVGDATISLNKTCKDLQTCCASISNASQKNTCTMAYDALKGSGDQACSVAISSFCP